MFPYASEQDALIDVLRLSRGMTYKAAISGLNLGGGKAVIIGDPKKHKSDLRLDIKAAVMNGGDVHGPAVVAGDAAKSPLIQLITSTDQDERMPHKGDALSIAEIATLTRWVSEGAVWPDGVSR